MDGTLLALLEDKVGLYGDRPLYSFLDRSGQVRSSLGYLGLYDKARGFAAVLQGLGAQRQPVLIYCPHGPEFIVAFFSCLLAGAWPVPVTRHRGQPQGYLSALLDSTGARIIASTRSRADSLSIDGQGDLHVLAIDEPCAGNTCWRRPPLRSTDTAFIQYTSGSTSAPRGVVISHANVLHNLEMIRRAFDCTEADIGLSWLPFHHDMGLIGHVMQPLYAGIHNYFMSPTDFMARPLHWLRAIDQYGATISGGPDFAYAMCCEHSARTETAQSLDLESWRLAYCGAEKVRASTLAEFARCFAPAGFNTRAFFPCYGLAEATLFVSGQTGLQVRSIAGQSSVSLGPPPLSADVAIVDGETGSRLAEGESGEVWLRSSSVASTYFNGEVNLSAAFNNTLDGVPGYLRTGDIGCLVQGELYLLGRSKNIFKRRGRCFHGEDIEEMLRARLPAALVSRVVAVAVTDKDYESLVILLEQAASPEAVTRHQPHDLAALARCLVVDQIGILPDDVCLLEPRTMPLTSSGKVRRQECITLYRQSLPANPA